MECRWVCSEVGKEALHVLETELPSKILFYLYNYILRIFPKRSKTFFHHLPVYLRTTHENARIPLPRAVFLMIVIEHHLGGPIEEKS